MTEKIKHQAIIGLALILSLISVLLGYLLMGHFVMATLTYEGMLGPSPPGGWLTTVKYLTHSWYILLLIGWVGLVLALGSAALALAGRNLSRRSQASLSAIAARFAIGGLIAGGVDVVLVGSLLFIGRL